MSKLLQKPFRAFTLYTLVILLASIPVYYWAVNAIWLEELDEHNLIVKERIETGLKQVSLNDNALDTFFYTWSKLEPGTGIAPWNGQGDQDSTYTVSKLSPHGTYMETDRFRGLAAVIKVNGKHYRLTIETNVEEADETFIAIAVITALFFVLLAGGFILLNKRISKKIWHPFTLTLNRLKGFDITKNSQITFEATGIEEFNTLNKELEALVEKNVSAYKQQKVFIENASHELQTPLALLRSKIDLLIQDKRLSAGQTEIVSSINRFLARVSRVNKNLLLLAKIENMQFADNEASPLAELLDECVLALNDYAKDKNIDLTISKTDEVMLTCNRFLLEMLLNNLLANAIQHNLQSGTIGILLNKKSLSISNSGNGPLQEEQFYKRFAAASALSSGSGLGLAIVKEICDRYGWAISYRYQNHGHTFTIVF